MDKVVKIKTYFSKNFIFLILFFLLISVFFSLTFISADIISINSGGDTELVITSNNILEGFFTGDSCIPKTCAQMNYACGVLDNGCGINLICGNCSSGYTCVSGVCTVTSPGSGGTTGGGGGGDSGGGGDIPTTSILVSPSRINLTLSYNEITSMSQRTTKVIYITNNGQTVQTLNISLDNPNLSSMIILSKLFITVSPNETKELRVDFISPLERGDFRGNILIGDKKVALFIKVTPNPLWFDSNIVVLNKDYLVSQGGQLRTKVELVPMGDPSRLDVTLSYNIKDYNGKTYLTQKETLLVERRMTVNRNFGTGKLPLGKYVISLDLIYPGGIAPSSAHFEVVEKAAGDIFGMVLFFLVLFIIIVVFLLVLFLILRRRRREKEEAEQQFNLQNT